jgi:hypothetical protein
VLRAMFTGPVFSPHDWLTRSIHALLWALVAIGFGGIGWLFGVRPIVATIQNWQAAQHYRELDAKIATRTVRLTDGSKDVAVVVVYDIDGKPYITERLTPADDDAFDEPDNAGVYRSLLPLAKMEATTKVWVDPADPRTAMASRFFPEQMVLRRVSLAIAFPLLSLICAVAALGALGNFGYYRRFHNMKRGWIITAIVCALVFPLRRFLVDADADRDDAFLEFALIMEFIAFVFIFVSISTLFERTDASAKAAEHKRESRRASKLAPDRVASAARKKKR